MDRAVREVDDDAHGNRVCQIETVPPSDAEYIDREEKAALHQRNMGRWQLVFTHPFYHPRQVQKHFAVITTALAAAKKATLIGNQVMHLANALSAFSLLRAV